ncbi:MAG TPA: hypothetical protein VGO43_12700 [Pyrinomonadaceae bacterium]|nr:hypothetical protein [Pyrinomonadaceae bacterium]
MEKMRVKCLLPVVAGEEEIEQTIGVDELRGWVPVDAITRGGRPFLRWMEVLGDTFSEPFFHQTVEHLRAQKPAVRELLTDLDALLQLEKITDALSPTGFIFHGSRCGSTLVSNACRSLSGALMVTEAQVIDKIADQPIPADHHSSEAKLLFNKLLLRGAVSALGQRRTGAEQYYFIKFACFGILQYEKIKSIWPDVPCVFIYRDPLEVIASSMKTRPQWMLDEKNLAQVASTIGISDEEFRIIGPEEFCSRVLGKLYTKAAELTDSGLMLIRYEELSTDKILEIIDLFGIQPTPLEVEEIRAVSKLYSKDPIPARLFTRDAEDKRASVSRLAREMAERWAMGPFQRLNEQHEKLQHSTSPCLVKMNEEVNR